jgi:hypothetical protein
VVLRGPMEGEDEGHLQPRIRLTGPFVGELVNGYSTRTSISTCETTAFWLGAPTDGCRGLPYSRAAARALLTSDPPDSVSHESGWHGIGASVH